MTVAEYRALGWRGRLGYRLYRNPASCFSSSVRLTSSSSSTGCRSGRWARAGSRGCRTMLTNLGIAALAGGLIWLTGLGAFLMIHLPITIIAVVDRRVALLRAAPVRAHVVGSRRRLEPPGSGAPRQLALRPAGVLRWFTANIGVHHVHHLSSRIPYYRLPEVLRDHPELADVGRLTLARKLPLRAAGAVGREPQAAGFVPRDVAERGRGQPRRVGGTDAGSCGVLIDSRPPST